MWWTPKGTCPCVGAASGSRGHGTSCDWEKLAASVKAFMAQMLRLADHADTPISSFLQRQEPSGFCCGNSDISLAQRHWAPAFAGATKRRTKLPRVPNPREQADGLPQIHYLRTRKTRWQAVHSRVAHDCVRRARLSCVSMTPEQIVADFDYLTLEDIRACLAYAADRERQQLLLAA